MPTMRALQLIADRQVELVTRDTPPPPGPGEVQLRVRHGGLNHIDVWGWRGMAFAKRQYPFTIAVEAAGEVVAVGASVTGLRAGSRVVPFGAITCGTCRACREGRDNLCDN